MNTPSCPNHGEMKWKEGFSKTTGKPYAFWSCPTKLPDGSWCPTKGPKNAAPQNYVAPQGSNGPAPVAKTTDYSEVLERIAVALEKLANKDLESVPF